LLACGKVGDADDTLQLEGAQRVRLVRQLQQHSHLVTYTDALYRFLTAHQNRDTAVRLQQIGRRMFAACTRFGDGYYLAGDVEHLAGQ